MKSKILISILFFSFTLTNISWTQVINSEEEMEHHMDCLLDEAVRYIPEEKRSMVEFTEAKYLHAGIMMVFQQKHHGYFVEDRFVQVLLKYNLTLNRLIDNTIKMQTDPVDFTLKTQAEARSELNGEFSSIKDVVNFKGLFWSKANDNNSNYALFYKFETFHYGTGMPGTRYVSAHIFTSGRSSQQIKNQPIVQALGPNLTCDPCTPMPIISPLPANHYTEYPGNNFVNVTGTGVYLLGKYLFQRCNLQLKYDECNELPWNTEGNYVFDAFSNEIDERVSYSKVFGYFTLANLLGTETPTEALQFDVESGGNFYGWDGTKLILGTPMSGNPVSHERFFYAHALVDKKFNGLNISPFTITNGIKDFLAMKMLNKPAGQCNFYAFTDISQPEIYRNDLGSILCPSPGADPVDIRNTYSTFLTRCSTEIGDTKVEFILEDLVSMYSSDLSDFSLSVYNFYQVASDMYNNGENGITANDLCAVYSIINSNFSGCVDLPSNSTLVDYYIRDTEVDTGDEPYWFGQMWTSPDIVNIQPDGTEGNPIYVNSSTYNQIKVSITNRGCADGPAENDKVLKVYFSMASTGLSWDEDWITPPNGGLIGEETIPDIMSGAIIPITFDWIPPDPELLTTADKHHICIYARITDSDQTDHGNVYLSNGTILTENEEISYNTNKANNIAWKNMSLIDKSGLVSNDDEITAVYVHNPIPDGDPVPPTFPDNSDPFDIICVINLPPTNPADPTDGIIDMLNPFNNPEAVILDENCELVRPETVYSSDPDFFNKGELWLNYKPEGSDTWTGFGVEGRGYETGQNGWIKMTSPEFKMPGLRLVRGEHYVLGVKYVPKTNFGPSSFALVQTYPDRKIVGGETYVVYDSGAIQPKDKTIIEGVGQKKKEEDLILIQPNPFRNSVDIISSYKSEIEDIEVMNASGQRVFKMNGIGNAHTTLNTSDWTTGQYSIIIKLENGEKIIKNVIKS